MTVFKGQNSAGLPFGKFLEHFVQEIVRADAQAQILQQTGWIEFQKSMEETNGIDLTEGVGQLEYLGLREIKLTFCVQPVRAGFWECFKRLFNWLRGREAPAKIYCSMVPREKASVEGFIVTMTVCRTGDGRYIGRSEPGEEQLGGVYVTNIIT